MRAQRTRPATFLVLLLTATQVAAQPRPAANLACGQRSEAFARENLLAFQADAARSRSLAAQARAGLLPRPYHTACADGRATIADAERRRARAARLYNACGTRPIAEIYQSLGTFLERHRVIVGTSCARAAQER